MLKFSPVPGSHLTEEQAQRYGERLYELRARRGALDENVIIDDARDSDSPLHDGFEWDDSKAAYLYRREQASYIIRSVGRVVVEDEADGAPVVIREFLRVRIADGEDDLRPISEVASSPSDARSVLLAERARIAQSAKRLRALESYFAGRQSKAMARAQRLLENADTALEVPSR